MMDPPFRNGSPCRSPSRVHNNTMEALKEFLEQMTRTMEFLCNTYSKALKCYVPQNCNMPKIDLSIGLPPDSLGIPPTNGESPRTHLCRDTSNLQPASSSGEGNVGQMLHCSSLDCSVEEKLQEGRSCMCNERHVNATTLEKEVVIHKAMSEAHQRGHSFEMRNKDELRTFLEDMKKTIDTWSVRHRLLMQGRPIPTKEGADVLDGVGSMRTTGVICSQPHPTDSNVRDIDLVDVESADDVSSPHDKDRDVTRIEVCDEPNQRTPGELTGEPNQVFQDCAEKTEVACVAEPVGEKDKRNSLLPLAEQGKTDAVSLPSPELGTETACKPIPPQDVADIQDKKTEVRMGFQSAAPMHIEVDPVHSKSLVDKGEMDVKITSGNGSSEVDRSATHKVDQTTTENRRCDLIPKNSGQVTRIPPCNQDAVREVPNPPNNSDEVGEVAVKSYWRRVDVVDSPDWLPKGWITELKTRGTGQTAGFKDKHFYDPVSKRRFRSKKEVFCFLETGKLGRYKRRPKAPPVKKMLGSELPSAGQSLDSCQSRNASGAEASIMASSSMSKENTPNTSCSSTAPVTAPTGNSSNPFMPCRPGQASEWLVYESLASVPIPVFDHFRYTDYSHAKSMGNGFPASRPWFSNNAEFSRCSFVDKIDSGQSAGKSKDGQIFEFTEGEIPNPESVPRKSTTTAKESPKKASS